MVKSISGILTLLLLVGCASEQRTIKYYTIDRYTIEPQDTVAVGAATPLPYIVEVVDFTVAGPYNDTRIALRTDSHELEYYHYHQWAEPPSRAIRYYVWRVVHDANVFQVCQLRVAAGSPQLLVTGSINKLERVDDGEDAGAFVDGVLDLVNVRENRIVLSHRFNTFVPFPANTPMNVFANEVGSILFEETYAFIEKINDHYNAD